MRKIKLIFLIVFSVTLIGFLIQNSIRESIDNQANNLLASLADKDVAYFEEQLTEGCNQLTNTIIPCEWYQESGFMPPIVAGLLDGAYIAGMSIKDMAKLMYQYVRDEKVREQLNKTAKEVWENREAIYDAVKGSIKDYGKELSGSKGFIHSEYICGKGVFEIGTMLVGVGAVTKGTKIAKVLEKVTRKVSAYSKRLQKITKIRKSCPPCAKFFKNTAKLRNKLLSKGNIAETKRLLNSEWGKSGKKWDIFIKDYDAHHIIPAKMLDDSEAIQFYYNHGGKFEFNSVENGILLKKVSRGGIHAKHNRYSRHIGERLQEIMEDLDNISLPEHSKLKKLEKEIKKLISTTKERIIKEGNVNGIKINEIY